MHANTTSPAAEYGGLARDFSAFHKNHTNILLHLLTTPLGFIGLSSAILSATKSTSVLVFIVVSYLLFLVPSLSVGTFISTSILCIAVILLSRHLRMKFWKSALIICAAYAAQDLAHWLTEEKTFQASYSNGGQIDFTDLEAWSKKFVEHVVYLLPLCVDLVAPKTSIFQEFFPAWVQIFRSMYVVLLPMIFITVGNYCIDSKNGFCFFPGMPYFCRVLTCKIANPDDENSQKNNLSLIRRWAMSKNPPANMSSHYWYRELPAAEREAFYNVANCNQIVNMFRSLFSEKHFCLEVVDGMNEVYISGPTRDEEQFNSDQIFYTKHVDGPYGFIPFCSVYRCIVGMDKNYMLTTRFPMNPLVDTNALEGDVLGFDFNREVHHLSRDESRRAESDDYRVTLKLHYCMYPRVLLPLGKLLYFLNDSYNTTFRALFLKTINPQTLYEHFLAWNVVINTTIFNGMETFIGMKNLMFLASVAAVSWMAGEYKIFLYSTSYIHYIRYIGTYYNRENIDFGCFKRDVMLFKNVALVQTIILLVNSIRDSSPAPFATNALNSIDVITIAMVIGGYWISILATIALGIDRTYFGWELGICESKWITDFPYGVIPHPMILGQVVGLMGINRIASFKADWPILIPIHVALYFVHMFQEHFSIYKPNNIKHK